MVFDDCLCLLAITCYVIRMSGNASSAQCNTKLQLRHSGVTEAEADWRELRSKVIQQESSLECRSAVRNALVTSCNFSTLQTGFASHDGFKVHGTTTQLMQTVQFFSCLLQAADMPSPHTKAGR